MPRCGRTNKSALGTYSNNASTWSGLADRVALLLNANMNIVPEEDNNILGSLLQTTATTASISIALYAALYTIDISLSQVNIPRVIFIGLAISGNFSLVACHLIQRRLRIAFRKPPSILFRIESFWAHMYWGIILLWVVFLFLVFPGITNYIRDIFSGKLP
jgi:hypothetical protein